MALYKNGTTSQAIKSGAGMLHGVIVNSHSSGTLRFNDGASGTTSAGVKATGVLTASDVFSDGETITIAERTYTMVEELSGVANEVLIGASAAASLDNLKSAINASAGAGTTYGTGTSAHAKVSATTNTDTEQTVEYFEVGTVGNGIATTETCENAAWGAATLASGANSSLLILNTYSAATGSQVLTFPEPISFNSGLYVTVGGTIDYTIIYS